MNDFLILLQAKLDEAKSKGNMNGANGDIARLQSQLDSLKLQAEIGDISKIEEQLNDLKATISNVSFSSTALSNLKGQIDDVLKNISIGNINIGNAGRQAEQVGNQIGSAVSQGVEQSIRKVSDIKKSFSDLKNFSELNESIEKSFDVDPSELKDYQKILDKIKEDYAEFGQVKITNEKFNDGILKKFKVNIEQVNGDLKETKSFMLSLNEDGNAFVFDGLISGSESIVQHLDKSKNAINQTAEAINNLKLKTQVDKIQNLTNGETKNDYNTQLANLEASLARVGLKEDEIRTKTPGVTATFEELKKELAKPSGERNLENIIELNEKLQKEFAKSTNESRQLNLTMKLATDSSRLNSVKTMQTWADSNTKAMKKYGNSIADIIAKMGDLNHVMTQADATKLLNEFKKIQNEARKTGLVGMSFGDRIKNAWAKFGEWGFATGTLTAITSKIRDAASELKEVDTILTEISKTADQLNKKDLSDIGMSAFSAASKYGKKATDYLTGVKEMYRAGYENAGDLAELSTLAQSAGDMQSDLANDYLIATDAAYKLKGSTEALNDVLDGQNYITNNNALSMSDLAEATKIAASQSASAGISIDKATAALGTMIATTRQGGDVAARAWKAILMNLQQVEGEVEDGEIIDAESLSKYEKACEALGVSLKEVKNGTLSLRDPMKIMEELSKAYTSLDISDVRRANLINAVGGKYRGNQLNSLLENWNLYEKMLKDYASGSGSAMEEAMKSANNWEGSMNRLGNTFTKVVENIVKSDAVITIINGLNGILNAIDSITTKLGSLGSVLVGAGLFAGVKNIGKCRMSVRISRKSSKCFEYAPYDGDISINARSVWV